MKYAEIYIDFLKSFIEVNKPIKAIFDSSNGTAGTIARSIFQDNKYIEDIHINDNVDPEFPSHGPNPIAKGALDELKEKVVNSKADIGIAFDGDGDRAVFVDEKGRILPSHVSAMLFFQTNEPPFIVDEIIFSVFRSNNSIPLKNLVATKIGSLHIKNAMRENKAQCGAEYSGHFYFKDFYYLDSGILAAIKFLNILSKQNKKLSELFDSQNPCHISEDKIDVQTNWQSTFKKIQSIYKDSARDISKRDGLTLFFSDTWISVRPSNTEPIIRLIAGGKSPKSSKQLVSEIKKILN